MGPVILALLCFLAGRSVALTALTDGDRRRPTCNLKTAAGFWVDDSTRTDAEAEYGGAIGVWDVSKAEQFNQDLSRWDTAKVTTMENMFNQV
ncbi:hypothetical protein M885DRAFT_570899 [Pelagophyceae sp. CCMP2097]|nr:hypothetical protein M885DRAFT_570899 [Pelagophyceae sp. CCMP2097]